jgi:long-chain acyl-CoA synthetase
MTSTIVERFAEHVSRRPDAVALRYKSEGVWRDITWGQYGEQARRAGKGLMSLGLAKGDKMSLLSRNRAEWHIADVACLSVGGVTAPIYATNSPDQVRHVIENSDSKVAVVENSEQLEKVLKVRSELPLLRKVVVFEDYDGSAKDDLVITWNELLEMGNEGDDAPFDDAVASITPNDVATLVYTSGTTGNPKGVILTHSNVWWTATHSEQVIPLQLRESERALSYLPLSHIAERMISHFLQIYYGSQTWFAESLDSLLDDLKECKPTYFFGVPRVWEKFYAGVQAKMAAADPNDRKAKLARKALEAGRKVAEYEQEAVGRGNQMTDAKVPLGVKLQHTVLDKLVLHKVRSAFGLDECRLPLSAAAPLSPDVIWFFHSVGLKVIEIYGQSEDCGPTTCNPPDAVKIGSVGVPFPGVEVKIATDGEVLARGGNVMPGYYKDDAATKEVIDEDGWLHTGDVGEFDEHNYLTITDRKKDLIITAGGKNVAPQEVENRLKGHLLISQAVVVGDRRPFLTALITLDEEKATLWAEEHAIEGDLAAIANHERTQKEIEGAVNEVNGRLAKVESVRKFRILERDFLQEEEEITPTLKVRRKQISQIYTDVIETMYDNESPSAATAAAPQRK